MKNDNQNIMAIGGILAVIIFVGLCVKMITKIMEHLYRAFYVFKFMLQEFFYVLIEFSKIAIMVVGIGGIIFAAVYFTYRYYKMVKKGTELENRITTSYWNFKDELGKTIFDYQKRVDAQILEMNQRLSDAINRPALVPEKIELVTESENIVTATTVDDTGEQSSDDSKTKEFTQESNIKNPQDFINPY